MLAFAAFTGATSSLGSGAVDRCTLLFLLERDMSDGRWNVGENGILVVLHKSNLCC